MPTTHRCICHECCTALSREIDTKLFALREKYPDLVALLEDLRAEQRCAAANLPGGFPPPFVPFVYPYPVLPVGPMPYITCSGSTQDVIF